MILELGSLLARRMEKAMAVLTKTAYTLFFSTFAIPILSMLRVELGTTLTRLVFTITKQTTLSARKKTALRLFLSETLKTTSAKY